VTLIKRDGAAALVEWTDGERQRRGTVPIETVTPDGVDADVLAAAIPYGEPWADVIEGIDPAAEQELKQRGTWTVDDVLKEPARAQNALQRAWVIPVFKEMVEYARKKSKRD